MANLLSNDQTSALLAVLMDANEIKELQFPGDDLRTVGGSVTFAYNIETRIYTIRREKD